MASSRKITSIIDELYNDDVRARGIGPNDIIVMILESMRPNPVEVVVPKLELPQLRPNQRENCLDYRTIFHRIADKVTKKMKVQCKYYPFILAIV